VIATEGPLGAGAAHDVEGCGRQSLSPLCIGQHQTGHFARPQIAAIVTENFQQHLAGLAHRRVGGSVEARSEQAGARQQGRATSQRGAQKAAAIHREGFFDT